MYKRILVALDGSELARAAIPRAAELGSGGGSDVVLLRVVDTPETLRWQIGVDNEPGPREALVGQALALQLEEARVDLDHVRARLASAGVRSVTISVAGGVPGQAIIDTARQEGCEAILIASRGHSGQGPEALGPVAEYVIEHAGGISVEVVSPRGDVRVITGTR